MVLNALGALLTVRLEARFALRSHANPVALFDGLASGSLGILTDTDGFADNLDEDTVPPQSACTYCRRSVDEGKERRGNVPRVPQRQGTVFRPSLNAECEDRNRRHHSD